jgi:hypothetical protein
MKLRILVVLSALSYCVLVAPAFGINKCVDKEGRVAYSDQPCAGAATASRIEAPPPAASPSSSALPAASAALPANLKMLQACASGGSGACFQRDLLDKKCLVSGSDRMDTSKPECKTYWEDTKRFRSLKDDCRNGRVPSACFTLACAGGDASACDRMKGAGDAREDREAVRRQAARERGLPSGPGWYMHEDWYKHGDGRMTTSVICNANSSVSLIRKPPFLDRIFTSMTGDEHFSTIDAAAKKACGLATKG